MKHKRLPRWTPAAIFLFAGTTQSLAAGPFPAVFELSSLDGTNGYILDGIDGRDKCGFSVSCAGDVNGDGIDDLIIGARDADPKGLRSAGESYVVFGGAGVGAGGLVALATLNGANGFIINGIDVGDTSGRSVSSAGDINGDGIDDLIIGAPYADRNNVGYNQAEGESYIVFGAIDIGSGGVLELSSLNGPNGFVCIGDDPFGQSGTSVSSAGDVNGDGIDDIIIGARDVAPPYYGFPGRGKGYLVFGAKGIGAGGTLQLFSLNGIDGFVCMGIDGGDYSGSSVSSAGDVNGDGIDDLIIGAPGADPNSNYSGESYVVFGATEIGTGGTLGHSSLDGTNGFICNGITERDFSGRNVSSAGDLNDDGIDDITIGASGKSYVVFGGLGSGSNGTIELSQLNGINGFVCSEYHGRPSSAGDINGDGIDDLIIGDPFASPNGTNSGSCFIVFGGAGVGAGGSFDLAALDGDSGFRINGRIADDYCGFSVSSAGDVNGDGIDDMLIGAPRRSNSGSVFSGESYVVFGRADCSADLNADGVIDTADLGILLGRLGEAGPVADINGDGVVDTADLGILLSEFTTACS